jgi:putative toxin-antitoxin system antitoxin component (TIGR02293 family)
MPFGSIINARSNLREILYMTTTQHTVRLLGGKKVLGFDIRSTEDAINVLKQGIPAGAMGELISHLAISQNEFSEITGIAKRTMARRMGKERLKPEESNRVYRVANIVALTEEVFGDNEKSRAWLSRPNRALGGMAPLKMLDTDIGTEEVKKVLGRIVHGVYS